ncbi:MAG: hypothetical protein F6K24_33690 [Okeania sp. SIO2D1]|nr:hypothetical protein [Okeania sp. SIO2D1]
MLERKFEEDRRQKAEGRRQKAEGRGQKGKLLIDGKHFLRNAAQTAVS